RFISRPNFPEGIPNQPAGALFGIENTNRGCDFNLPFPRLLNSTGDGYSLGIATVPGGVPLFRNGENVVGGIGVVGAGNDDRNEAVAAGAAAASGLFVRLPLPDPGAVYIDGFRVPFVNAVAGGGATAVDVAAVAGPPAPEGWLAGPVAGRALSADDVTSIITNAIDTSNRTRAQIRLPLGSRTRMVIAVADLDGSILGLYRM